MCRLSINSIQIAKMFRLTARWNKVSLNMILENVELGHKSVILNTCARVSSSTLVHECHPQHLCTSVILNTCARVSSSTLVHECHPQHLCMSVILNTCAWVSSSTLVHECHPQHSCTNIILNTCARVSSSTLVHECHPQHSCTSVIFNTRAWVSSSTLVHECHPQHSCMSVILYTCAWVSSSTLVHECHPQHLCTSVILNTCAWVSSSTLVHANSTNKKIQKMGRSRVNTKRITAWTKSRNPIGLANSQKATYSLKAVGERNTQVTKPYTYTSTTAPWGWINLWQWIQFNIVVDPYFM